VRATAPLLLIASLLSSTGCAPGRPTQDTQADVMAVRALAQRALEAENSENLEAWLATVSDDVVLLLTSGPVRGKQALRNMMTPMFAAFDWQGQWSLDSVEVSGDLAVMWGPIETTLIAHDTGQRTRSVGYHLDVARRQADGTWLFTWWTTKERDASGSDL